ncbi:MAG: hypothetical protein ACR2JO_07875 [Mycobacteriales bacterium]
MTPAGYADASPNLRADGERETEFLSPRVLMREAAKVCDDLGLSIRGARLRSMIDRFVTEGRGDIDFRTWFIAYADPTGETAVRNVMREERP